MAVNAGTVIVDVEAGKVDGISRSIGKQADLGGKHLTGMFTKVAVAAGGIFAGVQITRFLGSTIKDFQESAKVGRLTEAVIKSTGAVAGITAKQIGDLSEALSVKSGIDDDLIQSGANVLATFTSVRNEVGEGNDIFNQATGAALDMSAALGQDMQSSVIQLGKALNDPIKGITALSRVGVSFTEQQKEQIKTLVESGDVLGAQKVILSELSKEFGGAAEAAADPIAKLQVVLGNAKETIGGAIFPIISQIAPVLSDAVSTIAPVLAQAFSTVLPVLTPIISAIGPLLGSLVTALTPVVQSLAPVFATIAQVAGQLGPILANIGTALGPVVAAFAGLVSALLPIIPLVASFIAKLVEGLAPVLPPIIAALTLIVNALIGGLGQALQVIGPPLAKVAGILGKVFAKVLTQLAPLIAQIAGLVGNFLARAFRALAPFLVQIANLFSQYAQTIARQLMPVLPQLVQSFGKLLTALLPLLPPLLQLTTLFVTFFTKGIIAALPVIVLFAETTTIMLTAFAAIVTALINLDTTFLAVWNSIKNTVSTAVAFIVGAVTGALNTIQGAWQAVWGGLSGFLTGIASNVVGAVKGVFNAVIGAINRGIGVINDALQIHINIDPPIGPSIGFDFDGPNIPKIPKLHTGTGPGGFQPFSGDEGLALLQRGEIVTPKGKGATVQIANVNAWNARDAAGAIAEELAWLNATGAVA